MMMKDTAARYRDWDELLLDIQRVQQNQPLAPLPPNAISTIALPDDPPPLPASPTSPGPRIKLSNDRFDAIAGRHTQRSFRGLRFTLILLLLAWFLLLANDRMNDPLGIRAATGLTIPSLAQPTLEMFNKWFSKNETASATNEVATVASDSNRNEATAIETHQEPSTAIETTHSEPSENSAFSHGSAPSLQPLATPPPPFSPQRLTNLVTALRENNTTDLRILLETPDPEGTPAQLNQARALFNRLPSEDALLTTAIQQRKNQTITLKHAGNDRQVTLLDAVDNTLSVLHQADGRRIEIPFAKLDPAERLRLMRFAENTSPAANAALAILAFRANDSATLRRLAPNSGALAPILQKMEQ